MADQRFRDVLFARVCERRRSLTIVFALILTAFFSMLVSLSVVEPGTTTYIVTVMNLVGLAVFGLLFAGFIVICRRRDDQQTWR